MKYNHEEDKKWLAENSFEFVCSYREHSFWRSKSSKYVDVRVAVPADPERRCYAFIAVAGAGARPELETVSRDGDTAEKAVEAVLSCNK